MTHRLHARPLLVLLALATLAPTSAGCPQLGIRRPTIEYASTRFVAADFEKIRVDVAFDVHNPNAIGVKLDGYRLEFAVDGLTLVEGVINQPLDLRGGKHTQLVIPVTVKWSELIAKITKGFSGDGLPFRIAGDVRVDTKTVLGMLKLPYEHRGTLPVIRPPKFDLKRVRLGQASLSKIDLVVDLGIDNSGSAIKLSKLAYALKLAGKPVVNSAIGKAIPVGTRGQATQALTLSVSPAQVGLALMQALIGKQKIDVAIAGDTVVDTGYGKIPLSFSDLSSLIPRK